MMIPSILLWILNSFVIGFVCVISNRSKIILTAGGCISVVRNPRLLVIFCSTGSRFILSR
jgi:hypothetical protein